MLTLKSACDIAEKAISRLAFNSMPGELYEPVKYILSTGGKRLRSCLVLLGCNLFQDDFRDAVSPAVAIEIFHNFTLLHDDIMDDASFRRNKPTVHTKWNTNTAILSGDVMSFLAYENLIQCREEIILELIRIFNRTAKEVCEGQQYDLNFESIVKVSEQEYLKMIELKTAVLIAASLKIGAIIGRAPAPEADHLYLFGKNVGMAFQLQDDILDVYGDPEVFGKKIGGDIIANKKTYLLVKTLQISSGEKQHELIKLINRKEIGKEEKIRLVTQIFDSLGIRNMAQEKVNSYFREARKYLGKVNVPESRKGELQKLADYLIAREH